MSSERSFTYEDNNEEESTIIIPTMVDYYPNFIPKTERVNLFRTAHHEIEWNREENMVDGNVVRPPRDVASMGDPGTKYRYSGSLKVSTGWHPAVLELRNRLSSFLGQHFNFVLCNLYRNGRDSIGYHSDDEYDLVENSIIASISLGCSRNFYLKHKKTDEEIPVLLKGGSLIVMKGRCQKEYRHSVPKDNTNKPRINFTFRLIRDDIEHRDEEDQKLVELVTNVEEPVIEKEENQDTKPRRNNQSQQPKKRSRVQGGWNRN